MESQQQSLQTLADHEVAWLSQAEQRERLLSQLESHGWVISQTTWQESLTLTVEPTLIERWLGEGRPYRKALDETGNVTAIDLSNLRQALNRQRGRNLPQRLRHWRIDGRRG